MRAGRSLRSFLSPSSPLEPRLAALAVRHELIIAMNSVVVAPLSLLAVCYRASLLSSFARGDESAPKGVNTARSAFPVVSARRMILNVSLRDAVRL